MDRVSSRFVARDVRRDIKIISVDRLDDGMILAQERTINVLYLSNGLTKEPEFGAPTLLHIATMWEWNGTPWGGLPDGTSIVGHILNHSELPNLEPSDTARKLAYPQH